MIAVPVRTVRCHWCGKLGTRETMIMTQVKGEGAELVFADRCETRETCRIRAGARVELEHELEEVL